jgi:GR25 family glycosyltransferase involved in LPS biosynthesis
MIIIIFSLILIFFIYKYLIKNKLKKNIKVKYYLINLKRRPDRLNSFIKNYPLNKSEIIKFEAVDGKQLSEIPKYFIYNPPKPKGEIGCFLSHKLLWEKISNDKYCDYGVIFEDDAVFSKKFQNNFKKILNSFLNFDTILYFGGRFIENYKMKNCINVKENIVKYDYNKEWIGIDCDRTTHSYIISKKCCDFYLKKFNECIEDPNYVFPPVDHWMMKMLRSEKKNIFHTYPLLCHSGINSDSDIRR